MDELEVKPAGPIQGTIRPPGSKSITNRALLCAALAVGDSRLIGILESDDTRFMRDALCQLGVSLRVVGNTAHVCGCGGRFANSNADLFVGNSGTTIRFLTAAVAIGNGRYRLDGVARMRARPIQDLLNALQQLGVNATSELRTGAPPVVVNGSGIAGGVAVVKGDISSQFLSALMMASPYAAANVILKVKGPLVSRPYVDMTAAVMRSFAAEIECHESSFVIPGKQNYCGRDFEIEPDASAASYFWAAAAISGGRITVEGLGKSSLQGDVAFCECLRQMGCDVTYSEDGITVTGGTLQGIDVDMNAISDTVQTLAVVALFAVGATNIRGVGHNRHKETDRIRDLATELRRLGATVDEFDDGLRIQPGTLRSATCETYDDHRMAMSLALAGLRQPGIVIRNPGCTAKTYPEFFEDLSRLAGTEMPR